MISLYKWLINEKGYTENEIEETLLRLEAGMSLPAEVRCDVSEYYEKCIQAFKGGK